MKIRRLSFREQALATPKRPPIQKTGNKRTPENLRLFIEALRLTGNISAAAREIGIARGTAVYWKNLKDPLEVTLVTGETLEFPKAWDDALEEAIDDLELSARRWAKEGLNEPIVYQGQLCYKRSPEGDIEYDEDHNPVPLTIPMRSQRMMEILLKANREKFREKPQGGSSGEGNGRASGVLVIPLSPSEEEWQAIAESQQRIHREGG